MSIMITSTVIGDDDKEVASITQQFDKTKESISKSIQPIDDLDTPESSGQSTPSANIDTSKRGMINLNGLQLSTTSRNGIQESSISPSSNLVTNISLRNNLVYPQIDTPSSALHSDSSSTPESSQLSSSSDISPIPRTPSPPSPIMACNDIGEIRNICVRLRRQFLIGHINIQSELYQFNQILQEAYELYESLHANVWEFIRFHLNLLLDAILTREVTTLDELQLVLSVLKRSLSLCVLHLTLTLPNPLQPLPKVDAMPPSSLSVPSPRSLLHSTSKLPNETESNSTISPPYSYVADALSRYHNNIPPVSVPKLQELDSIIFDCISLCTDKSKRLFHQCEISKTLQLERFPEIDDTEELQRYRLEIRLSEWCDVWEGGRWRLSRATQETKESLHFCIDDSTISHSMVHPTESPIMEWIPRHSKRIMPLYTFSVQPWKAELKVGSIVDALDTVQKWYTARVIESRIDALRISYDGWSSKYDEWLPRNSNRLAPRGAKAKGGRESGGLDHDPLSSIDDSSDPEIDAVAIWRGREFGSIILAELFEYFGTNKGFELMLQRIIHRQTLPISLSHVKQLLVVFNHAVDYFTRRYAASILLPLRLAVFHTLLDLSVVELRLLTKDLLESIIKQVEMIQSRLYSQRAVNAFSETFQLQCALKRLRCPIVERRVNGMAYIQDILAVIRRPNSNSFLSARELVDWIYQEHILDECFGPTGHHELIKRATDIIKFLSYERVLTFEVLDLIWSALLYSMKRQSSDENKLAALYKLLDEVAWQLEPQNLQYLFSKVQSIPYSEYTVATLDLIRELTKWTQKAGPEAAQKAMAMLWDVLQEGSGVTEDIQLAARAILDESMKSRAWRAESLKICGTRLQMGENVPLCSYLLKQLIGTYPDYQNSAVESHTKGDIIADLNDSCDLLVSMLKYIKTLCSDASTSSRNHSPRTLANPPPINTSVVLAPSYVSPTFISNITESINFLHYILFYSNLTLSKEQIDSLWDNMITKSLSIALTEQFLDFLRRGCEVRLFGDPIFTEDMCFYIFETYLLQHIHFTGITLAMYSVFETFFLHVHSISGNIEFQVVDRGDNELKENTFRVVNFSALTGINQLWRIALEATQTEVATLAISFLNKLHEQLSDDLKSDIKKIRAQYISVCMEHFNDYIQSKDVPRTLRCISMLNNLLDASEVYGLGESRPHCRCARGKRITVFIQTSGKKNSPSTKFSLKVHVNDSLYEMLDSIHYSSDSVKLFTGGKRIYPSQLSHTLLELHIRDQQTILLSHRPLSMKRAELLERGQLSAGLRAALTDIYHRYACTNGSLSRDDMASYIVSCGAGENSATPQRLQSMFRRHGVRKVKPTNYSTSTQKEKNSAVTQFPDLSFAEGTEVRETSTTGDVPFSTSPSSLSINPESADDDDTTEECDLTLQESEFSPINYHPGEINFGAPPHNMNEYIDPHEYDGPKSSSKSIVDDDPQLMDLNGFMEFYFDACHDRADAVWNDLKVQGYRPDLTKIDEEDRPIKFCPVEVESLPRSILSSNEKYMDLLFSALETNDLSVSQWIMPVWDLLQRLPTSPKLYTQLRSIAQIPDVSDGPTGSELNGEHANGNINWYEILDSRNIYRCLYALQLVYSFIETYELADGEQGTSELSSLTLEKRKWTEQFVVSGGFHVLLSLLSCDALPSPFSHPHIFQFSTLSLSLVLCIIRSYVYSAICIRRPLLTTFRRLGMELLAPLTEEEKVEEAAAIVREEEKLEKDYENDLYVPYFIGPKPEYDTRRIDDYAYGKRRNSTNSKALVVYDSGSNSISNSSDVPSRKFMLMDASENISCLMDETLSNTVLHVVSLPDLLQYLWNVALVYSATEKMDDIRSVFENMIPNVMEPLFSILVTILFYEPETLLPFLYSTLENFPNQLLSIVMCPHSHPIRNLSVQAILLITSNCFTTTIRPPHDVLLDFLLNHLPVSQHGAECDELFYLMARLLKECLTPMPSHEVQSETENADEETDQGAPVEEDLNANSISLSPLTLLNHFETALQSHQSIEQQTAINSNSVIAGESVADKILQGLLSMIYEVLSLCLSNSQTQLQSQEPDESINYTALLRSIFHDFLFDPDYPRSLHRTSRMLALRILSILAKLDRSCFIELFRLLLSPHAYIPPISVWDYNIEKQTRSAMGYMGLRNLGSTCYMNSLLQQLYMMPLFRTALLASITQDSSAISTASATVTDENDTAIHSASSSSSTSSNQTSLLPPYGSLPDAAKRDSLLYQLYVMFGFLSLSERLTYDTSGFFSSYKDENGRPINVRIQQDAQEFFNVLCDRLEKAMKLSKYPNLVKSMFCGKLINQLICHGACKSIRESEEDFYCVSLQVKNRTTLKDSLESYVAGEVLSGFNCPQCRTKVEITKRTCLGELSPTMMFHLKRFEFNFETFQHEKLNNRLEFPIDLDLEPYTREGLARIESERQNNNNLEEIDLATKYTVHPKEYYQYKLAGILVHTGNASGGHYFSYIRATNRLGVNSSFSEKDEWLEFNDNLVRPFDITTIDEHCFGGSDTDIHSWSADMHTERIKNAYMLVYERVPIPSQTVEADNQANLPYNLLQKPLRDFIADDIKRNIRADNLQLTFHRYIINPDHFSFLTELIGIATEHVNPVTNYIHPSTLSDSSDLEFIKFATMTAIHVIIHTTENRYITAYMGALLPLFARHVPSCIWLLEHLTDRPELLVECLLGCRDIHVRTAMMELMLLALRTVCGFEQSFYYCEEGSNNAGTIGSLMNSTSVCVQFLRAYLSLILELPKHWMRFNEYFLLLYKFAATCTAYEQTLLINLKCISRIADLYLGDSSPLWDRKQKRASLGNLVAQPEWGFALKCIALLCRCCATDSSPYKGLSPLSLLSPPYPIRDDDVRIIKARELYTHTFTLNQPLCMEALLEISTHWSFENWEYSRAMIELLFVRIQSADPATLKSYFDMLRSCCSIMDSLTRNRLYLLFGVYPNRSLVATLQSSRHQSVRFTVIGIMLLLEWGVEFPELANVLLELRTDWLWMDIHMYDYAHKRRSHFISGSSSRNENRMENWQRYVHFVQQLNLPLDPYITGETDRAATTSSSSSNPAQVILPPTDLPADSTTNPGSSHVPLITRRGLAFAPLDASSTSTKEWEGGDLASGNGYTINENGDYTEHSLDINNEEPGNCPGMDDSFNEDLLPVPHAPTPGRPAHRRHQNHEAVTYDYGMSASSDCLGSSLTSTPSENTQSSFFSSNAPTEWPCSACTFINPNSRLRCDVCETERP